MTDDFMIDVYDTLRGETLPSASVPNVENLYEEGKPYYRCYEEISHAYERLRDRLGVIDEDNDVETMLSAFIQMERMIAEKMFFYGAHFALDEHFRMAHPKYFR